MSELRIPTFSDVFVANQTVRKYLKPTPLIYSRRLSRILDCQAYLKLENLQPTTAFKVRGGIWYMSKLQDEAKKKGVITASTGNHAQSIAYAGSIFGIDVKVVMPEGSPALKIESTKELGAEVILKGRFFDEALQYTEKLAREYSYLLVHGINEPLLYEGVGSMHLEVIEELPDVDVVINPIGGGSGTASACIVYKALNPKIKVIGVQAEGAPAMYESLKSGSIVTKNGIETKAEGLATSRAYELPFKIFQDRLDDIVLVGDDDLYEAVRIIFQTTKQVAELAGAAAVAAALRKIKDGVRGKKVVLMLTGGNISSESFSKIIG
ncbi:MAG: pyridoxal-phosphate dependent enzyme [Thaumarchaeota archaeon]|nr:pyridoxal-phosphate dependent enzyme [Nitrososphaerota archaeon]